MADLSGLGDLVLTVGGDITPLTSALDEIPAAAQSAASQIQAAFDALPSATEGVNASLANLSTGLSEAGAAASETAGHVEQLPPVLHDTSEAAGEAGSKLKEFVTAGLELAGIALSFEALKGAIEEIVSSFDQLQRATISLTALTGSAEQANTAIDSLKTMAIGEGLSFPSLVTAQQRMYAFGISATQIPQLLQAAANAAAVMGTDIESAAQKLDRIAVSGTVAARQLTSLGLTTHDLATAMGVADSAVKSTFASMDQSQRVDVLIAALQKFQGVAAAVANTLSGSWQSFKTSVEVALEGVGEAIDTGLTSVVKTAQESVVPGIQAMVQAFTALASVVGPALTAAVNGIVQTMGDLATIVGSATSEIVKLAAEAAGMVPSSKAATVSWTDFFNVIIPGKAAIHEAAVEIELLSADAIVFGQSADIMAQRFASVTDSLKSFIDKTSTGHDNLLAIRTDFEALQQAVTKAQTQLALVTDAYNKGMASAGQLEAATKALTTAQTALNGTLDTSKLTMASIATAYDALKTALATANTNLDLVSKAYLNGQASLAQYQAAVTALKTAQDALNGSLTPTPAQQVTNEFNKLNTNLAQAKDYLAAVTAAMQSGQASLGQYQSAVAAVNSAQQALSGTLQTTAATISSSAPKVIDVSNALSTMGTSTTNTAAKVAGFVGPVQQVNDAVQVLNGSVSTLTDNFDAAKVTVIGAGDAFSQTAADLVDYVNEAANATAATETLTAAMDTAASAAGSLGSQLNASMATASEGGGTLGTKTSLKAGDQFQSLLWNPNVDPGGAGMAAGWGSGTFGPMFPLETQMFDPATYAATLKQSQQAATSLTTAGTALTAAATLQQTAAQTAYDAAKAATVAAQIGTTAASSISASALAAANAANQQAFANAGFASVVTQTNTVTAATVQALALATNTMVGAASVITAVAVKAGVPLTSNAMAGGSVLGSLNLPNVSLGSGLSASTGGMPFAPPVFPSGPNTQIPSVNITGGPQFVQSLFNEFTRQLQTQGIRLTRG